MVDERLIAGIRRFHRDRCFMMDTRKVVDLRLGAHLRRVLGWRKNLPEAERKAIALEAARMMEDGDGPYEKMITASNDAREIFAANEGAARKEMAKLAKLLPVWESFGKDVRGFGEVSLAVIVAEAGDLSNYATDAKLWKRMGVAVLDGARQGQPGQGATKDDWIAHGYSPKRRSHMWNIGDALVKGNRDGKYRTLYLARKEHEHARDPEMSKMHAHRRAQRYMEKRLLRDLWRAWRRANAVMAERPNEHMPAAYSSAVEAIVQLAARPKKLVPPLRQVRRRTKRVMAIKRPAADCPPPHITYQEQP